NLAKDPVGPNLFWKRVRSRGEKVEPVTQRGLGQKSGIAVGIRLKQRFDLRPKRDIVGCRRSQERGLSYGRKGSRALEKLGDLRVALRRHGGLASKPHR